MTREEMIKTRWKPYMSVEYQSKGMAHPVECLLLAIDFDAEILTLIPLNEFYQAKEIYANLRFCSLSKRLKTSAINGEKVKIDADKIRAERIGIYIEDYNEAS